MKLAASGVRAESMIPAFQNVEVYDVMADILGITPLPNDGTGTLAKEILK
ncbi:MAG TPA: hypothetical protein VGC08_12950 [Pedobacter sp.]